MRLHQTDRSSHLQHRKKPIPGSSFCERRRRRAHVDDSNSFGTLQGPIFSGMIQRMKLAHMSDLDEIRETFGLSKSELGDLLGRRAQSIAEWQTRGVPQEQVASVERLRDLARLFRRKIIASRIPQVVRTPDAWLGERTILQVLKSDGIDSIYGYLGRLFSYASA